MSNEDKINYLEIPAENLEIAKEFFATVFNWHFADYGPDYTAFSNAGMDGGFFKSSNRMSAENGSALIVFYSKDLDTVKRRIEEARGRVIKDIFSFPGGRRFHFCDPNNNEFAVWSDEDA